VGSLIVVLVALLVISAATTLGPRLGFAAPLLLVVVGMWASLLPFVPDVDIEPSGWSGFPFVRRVDLRSVPSAAASKEVRSLC
jgi:hypothetical protein